MNNIIPQDFWAVFLIDFYGVDNYNGGDVGDGGDSVTSPSGLLLPALLPTVA